VKLFLHFKPRPNSGATPSKEKNTTMIATGWLIAPDLVVTAGSCTYDWSYGLGRLIQAQAIIGYASKASVRASNTKVQMRDGKLIATTAEWVKTKGSRQHDVAFIKLEKPFTGVTPFKFDSTPLKGNVSLGVVGYPGDLKDDKTGEPGAYMYEMFLDTEWQLAASQWSMEYMIDTAGGKHEPPFANSLLSRVYLTNKYLTGNSGSPVLRGSHMASIGVHTYGGAPNSASVIGPYGNQIQTYLQALNNAKPINGIQYVSVRSSTIPFLMPKPHSTPKPNSIPKPNHLPGRHPLPIHPNEITEEEPVESTPDNQDVDNSSNDTEEGWLKFVGPFLKKAASVALPAAFGSLGIPLSVLANVGINAAGKVIEHKQRSEGDVSDSTDAEEFSCAAERAVLAEAAFQAMTKCDYRSLEKAGFFARLRDNLKISAPLISKVTPSMADTLGPSAMRLAIDTMQNGGQLGNRTESSPFDHPPFVNTTILEATFEGLPSTGQESFSARLKAADEALEAQTSTDNTGHSDSDTNGDANGDGNVNGGGELEADTGSNEEAWLNIAWRLTKPAIPAIIKAVGGGEGSISMSSPPAVPIVPAGLSDTLYTRAIVAEAVLQAAIDTKHSTLQEEGFVGSILGLAKKALPLVKKWRPTVIIGVAQWASEGKTDEGGDGEDGVQDGEMGELWKSLNDPAVEDDPKKWSVSFIIKWTL
jgi:V8-like Glu-specific endopeptidase